MTPSLDFWDNYFAGLAAAQRALDDAQRAFLEEVTPAPVVYIR